MTPTEALIALNMVPKLGPVRIRRLLDRFGSADAILTAQRDQLIALDGFGPETIKPLLHWEDHVDLSTELATLKERQLHVITPQDDHWPKHFEHLYDAPLLLYVWGKITPADSHALAIVGSRRATHYGLQQTKKIAYQLAYAGYSIISGLARGIDTAAHEGAIAAGGRTLAVLGSGLSQLYPPENIGLAERIADGHGAVLSEYPLTTPPSKTTFPQRNRIVAAWNSGLLVTECPSRSGALITANLASDNGKQIFALPGPVDRPNSGGCHDLIRQGAVLVTSGTDILDDLSQLSLDQPTPLDRTETPHPTSSQTTAKDPEPTLSEEEKKILQAIGSEERNIDDLVRLTKLDPAILSPTLLQLEMKAKVRALPGLRYARK